MQMFTGGVVVIAAVSMSLAPYLQLVMDNPMMNLCYVTFQSVIREILSLLI